MARPWMGLRLTVGVVCIGTPLDSVGPIAHFESQRIPRRHVGVSGNEKHALLNIHVDFSDLSTALLMCLTFAVRSQKIHKSN